MPKTDRLLQIYNSAIQQVSRAGYVLLWHVGLRLLRKIFE